MKWKNYLSALIAAGSMFLQPMTSFALSFDFFGEIDTDVGSVSSDLNAPGMVVYHVKCQQNPNHIWAQVKDVSYPASNTNIYQVSAVCVSPTARRGHGALEYADPDAGRNPSHWGLVTNCREALVTISGERSNNNGSNIYESKVACAAGDFASGFPKRINNFSN